MGKRLDRRNRSRHIPEINRKKEPEKPVHLTVVQQVAREAARYYRDYDRSVSALEKLFDSQLFLEHKHGVWRVYAIAKPTKIWSPEGGEVVTLWHGTPARFLGSIMDEGRLRPSYSGLLGPGVYLGTKQKALSHVGARSSLGLPYYLPLQRESVIGGVLLECRAALGKIKVAEGSTRFRRVADEDTTHLPTLYGQAGVTKSSAGTLRYDEWCVRDPRRVSVVKVHIEFYRPPLPIAR